MDAHRHGDEEQPLLREQAVENGEQSDSASL
jgi:hypothetical protein